jgi:hypothetical protein
MKVKQKFSLSLLQRLMGEQAITMVVKTHLGTEYQVIDWNSQGFELIELTEENRGDVTHFKKGSTDENYLLEAEIIAIYELVGNLDTYSP